MKIGVIFKNKNFARFQYDCQHGLKFKKVHRGDIYYLETKCKAIIFTFSVVWNQPELESVMEKWGRKEELMYLVANELHQALVELDNPSEL